MRLLKRLFLWCSALVLVLLLMIAGGMGYLWQHPKWVLAKINQALAPYQLHIHSVDWQLPDASHLRLPLLALDYAGNEFTFSEVDIALHQPVSLRELWQLYQLQDNHQRQQTVLDAIAKVEYRQLDIRLPLTQLLPTADTKPLWLPLAGKIPTIALGRTNIWLKDTTTPIGLQLRQLHYTPDGTLSSVLALLPRVDNVDIDTPTNDVGTLLTLRGKLPLHINGTQQPQWQLHADLRFDSLNRLLKRINRERQLTTLVESYPWLASDWLPAQMQPQGELSSDITIQLANGSTNAHFCWQQPQLNFPAAANSQLILRGNGVNAATSPQGCPADAIAVEYQQQQDRSAIRVSAISAQAQLSKAQRQAWLPWLSVGMQQQLPSFEHGLQQLSKQIVAPMNDTPDTIGLNIALADGIQLTRQTTAANHSSWQINAPSASIKPHLLNWFNQQLNASAAINLHNIALTLPQADVTTASQGMSLSSDYALNLDLPRGVAINLGNSVPQQSQDAAAPSATPFNASLGELRASFAGQFSYQHHSQTHAEVTITPTAAIQANQVSMAHGDRSLTLANVRLTPQAATTASWHDGALTLALPAITGHSQQLAADAAPYQLTMAQLDLRLPAVQQLALTLADNSDKTAPTLWQQLQQQTFSGQLDVAMQRPHVSSSKTGRLGSNRESILNLRQINLSQQIDWHHATFASQEQWQVDDIALTSQHQLALHNNGYQLNSDWQLQSPLSALQQLAAKNIQLQDNWHIDGQSQFAAQLKVTDENHDFHLSLDMQPKIIAAAGDFKQLPFADLNLDANCHYQLDAHGKTINYSNIGCSQFALTSGSFNPGIALSDIDIRGRGIFMPTNPNTTVNSWLLPGIKDAKMQLKASAQALNGELLIPDFDLDLQGKSHGMLLLRGMDIEKLLEQHPQESITATGVFDGVLPVTMENRQITISGGRVAARHDGLIEIHDTQAINQMRQTQPYLDYVLDFMQQLQYHEILGSLDMQANGDTKLALTIKGNGQGIDRPVNLNYSHQENLLKLLQSLTIGERLQSGLEASMQ